MTDREFLELAAIAYGLYGVDPRGDDDLWVTDAKDEHGDPLSPSWGMFTVGGVWNPLEDDGDAFRLAVKLRMKVESWFKSESACAYVECGRISVTEPHYGDDPARATRLAIVRAAASMSPDLAAGGREGVR